MLVTLQGKTGWREVEVGRGSSDATCPVASMETWIKFAKLAHGPLFRRVTGQGKARWTRAAERQGSGATGKTRGNRRWLFATKNPAAAVATAI
jgi:hypothetical protein